MIEDISDEEENISMIEDISDEEEDVDETEWDVLKYQLECSEILVGELQINCHALEENNADLLHLNLTLRDEMSELQRKVHLLEIKQHQLLRTMLLRTMTWPCPDKHVKYITETRYRQGAVCIKDNDKGTNFYAGLPSYERFNGLFQLLLPLIPPKLVSNSDLSLMDEYGLS